MDDSGLLPNYGRISGTLHLSPRARHPQAGEGATLQTAADERPKVVPLQPNVAPVRPPNSLTIVENDTTTEIPIEVVKVVERLQEDLGEAKTAGENAEKSKP